MQKNTSGQKLIVFAFDSTTNLPKTGDAANLTAYVSIDYGAVTVLGDTSATEMDATNAKGYYLFDLTQGETNGNTLLFTAKSSTANIVVVGAPAAVFTTPANFALESIDSNGRVDVIKIAGTTQTARDVGASVLLSSGTGTGQLDFTSGVVKANVTQLLGTAWLTPGTAGTPDVNVKLWNGLTTVALPLVPTTAGRTLDVSAGGEAGIDWANVGSPTTVVSLSGTTVGTVTTVTNQLTAAQIATGVWQDATSGDFTVASSIGKALYIANVAPGGSGGHLISGSNSGTTTLGALTVTGATTLAAVSGTTLTLSGAVAFQSTFATTGTTTFNALTVTNALTVSGSTTLTGAVSATNAANDVRGITVSGYASGQAPLQPTVAGRTLDVTATGTAGIDWGNVENQGTVVGLSNTSIAAATRVTSLSSTELVTDWGSVTASGSTSVTYATGRASPYVAGLVGCVTTVSDDGDTGTTEGQPRVVTAAVDNGGGSITLTVDRAWTTNPALDDTVTVWAFGPSDLRTVRGTASTGAAGYVGVDWGQVTNKTTTNALTGTTIASTQKVDLDTIKTNPVVNAGTITFPTGATLASTTNVTAGTITTVTNLTNAPTSGDLTATMKASVLTTVWDSLISGHTTTGTFGGALNAAGSAGDPWATTLPGAYSAGTAGHIIGTALPDIAPGSTNGLLRGGTNTATTFATLTSTGAFTVGSIVNNGTTDVAQTGDSFARIGATGSGLTSLAPAATALSTATWTGGLATALTTLASHDPGATIGTSTLTQTQVTGGAYSVQSALCVLGDARIGNLDATVSSRAPSATALSTTQWTNVLATNLGTSNTTIATNLNATVTSRASQVSVDDVPTNAEFAAAVALLSTSAQAVKLLAAVYDSATGSGGNVLTLSNGAVQTINLSTGSRTTT